MKAGFFLMEQVDTYKYIGWIPCLEGEMFFRYTEPGLGHYDVVNINQLLPKRDGTPDTRIIIASSVYDWKDSGQSDENGLFRVVVIATANSVDSLQGELFLINPVSAHNRADLYRSDEGRLVRELLHLQDQLEHVIDPVSFLGEDRRLAERLEKEGRKQSPLKSLVYGISGARIFSIPFTMDGSGITYLELSHVKEPGGTIVREHSMDALSERTLCRQAFYYLKYLFHKHAHHDRSNDSLTTIHDVKPDPEESGKSLIRDIKRGLVDLRRDGNYSREVAGIASYGKSLALSCYRSGLVNAARRDCEVAYFDNLAESLKILCDEKAGKAIEFFKNFQLLLSVIFLFIAPFAFFAVNKGSSPKTLVSLIDLEVLVIIYLLSVIVASLGGIVLTSNRALVFALEKTFYDYFRFRAFSLHGLTWYLTRTYYAAKQKLYSNHLGPVWAVLIFTTAILSSYIAYLALAFAAEIFVGMFFGSR